MVLFVESRPGMHHAYLNESHEYKYTNCNVESFLILIKLPTRGNSVGVPLGFEALRPHFLR